MALIGSAVKLVVLMGALGGARLQAFERWTHQCHGRCHHFGWAHRLDQRDAAAVTDALATVDAVSPDMAGTAVLASDLGLRLRTANGDPTGDSSVHAGESHWSPVEYGPVEIELWIDRVPLRPATRLLIDGREVHPELLRNASPWTLVDETWRRTLVWTCPTLGRHTLQLQVDLASGAVVTSQPISFEVVPPQRPEVLAAGGSLHALAPVTSGEIVSVFDDGLLVKFAMAPAQGMLLDIPGLPPIRGEDRGQCCFQFSLSQDLTIGRHALRFRRVVGDTCSMTSPVSDTLWIQFQPAHQLRSIRNENARRRHHVVQAIEQLASGELARLSSTSIDRRLRELVPQPSFSGEAIELFMPTVAPEPVRAEPHLNANDDQLHAPTKIDSSSAGDSMSGPNAVEFVPQPSQTDDPAEAATLDLSPNHRPPATDPPDTGSPTTGAQPKDPPRPDGDSPAPTRAPKIDLGFRKTTRSVGQPRSVRFVSQILPGVTPDVVQTLPAIDPQVLPAAQQANQLEQLSRMLHGQATQLENAMRAAEQVWRDDQIVSEVVFDAPAYFSRKRYGRRAQEDARMGLVLLEGMQLASHANGRWQLRIPYLQPTSPVVVHLQLQFKTQAGHWKPLTIEPICIPAGPECQECEQAASPEIVRTGYSAILEREVGYFTEIRRRGSATFGWGFDGLRHRQQF